MLRRPAAVASILVAVAACSTPTQNFRDQTEEFLNESPRVSDDLFGGADVSGASCERPDDTAIGTTYRCTADVAGQGAVTFTIQITAENGFTIVDPAG